MLTRNRRTRYPTDLYGAFHGSEVPWVFYDAFELTGPDERNLSMAMVQYWVNFATSGDPNTPSARQQPAVTLPVFPKYNGSDDSYAVLGDHPVPALQGKARAHAPGLAANISTVRNLKVEKCQFWDTFATRAGLR